MKKLLLLSLLLSAMTAMAQDFELNQEGAYEKKQVVEVNDASAIILYERAIEALSDWTGPDGRSKAGIDYSEKETGTVIYKGRFSLGFKNIFLGEGWSRYANFILKVRCKDGRAQVSVTVPSILAIHTSNGQIATSNLTGLIDAVKNAKGKKHERGIALLETIKESVDILVGSMTKKLQTNNNDDF